MGSEGNTFSHVFTGVEHVDAGLSHCVPVENETISIISPNGMLAILKSLQLCKFTFE